MFSQLLPNWVVLASLALRHRDKLGEIHFIKKDTGEKAVVKAASLLPLLTQSRQTSRGAGNWGNKVLPDRPGEVAIELE